MEKTMKKTLWIAISVALAASVIAASAQEVLSANAVGYIKKTLPAGGDLIALSAPLNSMTDTNIVFGDTSIADEAPLGSVVYFWDEVLQVWSGGSKSIIGWSPAQANRVIVSGEAFFLKGNVADVSDVEVPEDIQLSRAIIGSSALGTVGNPYPVDFTFGTSAIASNASLGSVVYFWDEALQVWSGGSKSIIGWAPAQANRVVLAAEGFFLKDSGAGSTWDENKPYTWP
jgi:predicted RecA/RadA family phage recombinase